MARFSAVVERLRSSLWLVPALFATGAFLLAALTLSLDRILEADGTVFNFGGSADGARDVLATIAQSMLTFTALVFSITMLVLQLASSQLSPRVMRTFLRDRSNQVVLGLFVATFLFTLLVLRDVRSSDSGDEFVPGLSITLAFVLLLASVAAFIYYIDHMAHAVRATTVISSIAGETADAIERLYPEALGREPVRSSVEAPDRSPFDATVVANSTGNLVSVDEDGLFEALRESGIVAELVPMVGEFVADGQPLFRLRGPVDEDLAGQLRAQLSFSDERTMQQDAAFGFRQLVDIGLRALSPSTNDPSTAVQAIDRLHELLRQLARREFPSSVRLDDRGQPLLVVPRPDWADYVRLAVEELRIAGSGQVQVRRRLKAMLDDLATVAGPDRRVALRRELDAMTAE
jgi:uncharacterized membrane protein